MGEFFEAHPGPHLSACQALASELRGHRFRLHYFPLGLGPYCFTELEEPAHGPPVRARLALTADLSFLACARKRSGSLLAARFETYCTARTVGEFFELHPGPSRAARADLARDFRRGLCHVPGYSPP